MLLLQSLIILIGFVIISRSSSSPFRLPRLSLKRSSEIAKGDKQKQNYGNEPENVSSPGSIASPRKEELKHSSEKLINKENISRQLSLEDPRTQPSPSPRRLKTIFSFNGQKQNDGNEHENVGSHRSIASHRYEELKASSEKLTNKQNTVRNSPSPSLLDLRKLFGFNITAIQKRNSEGDDSSTSPNAVSRSSNQDSRDAQHVELAHTSPEETNRSKFLNRFSSKLKIIYKLFDAQSVPNVALNIEETKSTQDNLSFYDNADNNDDTRNVLNTSRYVKPDTDDNNNDQISDVKHNPLDRFVRRVLRHLKVKDYFLIKRSVHFNNFVLTTTNQLKCKTLLPENGNSLSNHMIKIDENTHGKILSVHVEFRFDSILFAMTNKTQAFVYAVQCTNPINFVIHFNEIEDGIIEWVSNDVDFDNEMEYQVTRGPLPNEFEAIKESFSRNVIKEGLNNVAYEIGLRLSYHYRRWLNLSHILTLTNRQLGTHDQEFVAIPIEQFKNSNINQNVELSDPNNELKDSNNYTVYISKLKIYKNEHNEYLDVVPKHGQTWKVPIQFSDQIRICRGDEIGNCIVIHHFLFGATFQVDKSTILNINRLRVDNESMEDVKGSLSEVITDQLLFYSKLNEYITSSLSKCIRNYNLRRKILDELLLQWHNSEIYKSEVIAKLKMYTFASLQLNYSLLREQDFNTDINPNKWEVLLFFTNPVIVKCLHTSGFTFEIEFVLHLKAEFLLSECELTTLDQLNFEKIENVIFSKLQKNNVDVGSLSTTQIMDDIIPSIAKSAELQTILNALKECLQNILPSVINIPVS